MNNKLLEEIIKEGVDKKLEDYDNDYIIGNVIKEEIGPKIKQITDEMIEKEIKIVLSKPIDTNDGWGEQEHYDSFEDLFKKKFYEQLNNNYKIQRTIEKIVEEKLGELFKKKTEEVTTKIQDMVLDEMMDVKNE